MKNTIKHLATLAWLASALCPAATAQDFAPGEHSQFTTDRADGRYTSSRAIAHRLMLNHEPELRYRPGMNSEEFALWRDSLSQAMAGLMKHPATGNMPEAKRLDVSQRDGYRLERWEAYPLDEAVVPFLVLVPDGVDAGNPAPAILCIPGFGQTKELLAGETGNPDGQRSNAMARFYAKEGYVAVAVDNPSCGESGDLERMAGSGWDYVTTSRALLELDWSYLGYTSFIDKVILDWMKTRPEMRRDRLIVSGFSLGTEPLMALGATDPSIYAFVYNDFLCTTRERALVMTLPDQHGHRPWPNDISHLIPGFLTKFDFPDIVASLAPRPVICTEGGMDRDFALVADAFATAGDSTAFEYHHYPKYADPANRQYLDEMPEGIDRATFFRLANVDPPSHYFKAELVLPWLKKLLTE